MQLRARVVSGDYASEDEVIREALAALHTREEALEDWLRTDVAASYQDLKEHLETGWSLVEVRASFAAKTKPPEAQAA